MDDSVYVYEHGLDSSKDVVWMKDVALELQNQPNYWMPKEQVLSQSSEATVPHAERAIRMLYENVMKYLLPPDDDRWSGAEYWAQVYDDGRGLEFHFDKDEYAMKEEGRMINPLYSSVLYLTDGIGDHEEEEDGDENAVAGGTDNMHAPTIVIDQWFDDNEGMPVPENPTWSTFVFPKKNRYCVFDGRLGHGVLDSGCQRQRVVFLVNWWRTCPTSIDRCPFVPEDDTIASVTQRMKHVSVGNDEAALRATMQKPCAIQEIVLQREDVQDGPVLIDELLTSCGIPIGVDQSEHELPAAVRICHEGIVLCPIEAEDDSVNICGAFVLDEEDSE